MDTYGEQLRRKGGELGQRINKADERFLQECAEQQFNQLCIDCKMERHQVKIVRSKESAFLKFRDNQLTEGLAALDLNGSIIAIVISDKAAAIVKIPPIENFDKSGVIESTTGNSNANEGMKSLLDDYRKYRQSFFKKEYEPHAVIIAAEKNGNLMFRDAVQAIKGKFAPFSWASKAPVVTYEHHDPREDSSLLRSSVFVDGRPDQASIYLNGELIWVGHELRHRRFRRERCSGTPLSGNPFPGNSLSDNPLSDNPLSSNSSFGNLPYGSHHSSYAPLDNLPYGSHHSSYAPLDNPPYGSHHSSYAPLENPPYGSHHSSYAPLDNPPYGSHHSSYAPLENPPYGSHHSSYAPLDNLPPANPTSSYDPFGIPPSDNPLPNYPPFDNPIPSNAPFVDPPPRNPTSSYDPFGIPPSDNPLPNYPPFENPIPSNAPPFVDPSSSYGSLENPPPRNRPSGNSSSRNRPSRRRR